MSKDQTPNSGIDTDKKIGRRAFFVNSAKAVIPMLAVMGLSLTGFENKFSPQSSACNGTCYGACEGTCSGCSGNCYGSCSGSCYGTCGGSCSGTSG